MTIVIPLLGADIPELHGLRVEIESRLKGSGPKNQATGRVLLRNRNINRKSTPIKDGFATRQTVAIPDHFVAETQEKPRCSDFVTNWRAQLFPTDQPPQALLPLI